MFTKLRFTMRDMLWGVTLLAVLLASAAIAQETKKPEPKDDGEWIQLFNGKNLDGWTPKIRYHELGENWNDTFRVEDGLLKVSYDKYDKFNESFGHLFYKEAFSHYV